MSVVARFEVKYYQYLDESSTFCHPLPPAIKKPEFLVSLYETMVMTRVFDEKAVNLQRTGKIGTFPSSLGQEAIAVGTGAALEKADIYCPNYRDQGAMFRRGVLLSEVLSYWAGDERGSYFKAVPEDLPIAIPIATQLLHAAGVAYALKFRQEPRVVVAMCGDGATSEGDFYEALNIAGVWKLPIVFVINNNQWAISVPVQKQTKAQTLAQKAIAGGFDGVQVDGNDVVAVYDRISEAVRNARQGGGPQLIEGLTYRLSDHTTADDMKRYCPAEALENAWKKEPIQRLRCYLENQGLWSPTQEQDLFKKCQQQMDQAIDQVFNHQKEPPQAMFESLYENFPDALQGQYESVWQSE